MEHSKLDLTKVNFDEKAPDMHQFVGVTPEDLDQLAHIMAEETTAIVKGDTLTTVELCNKVLARINPRQAAFLLTQTISSQVIEKIQANPVASMLTLLSHGERKGQ